MKNIVGYIINKRILLLAAIILNCGMVSIALAEKPPKDAAPPTAADDLYSILNQTAFVVDGLVEEIRNVYDEGSGPWTEIVLNDVTAVVGSEAPSSITIRQFGGILEDGRVLEIVGQPIFYIGKRYIVFLRNTAWNLSPVVANFAFRVEEVDGFEVLVNDMGKPIADVNAIEVEFSEAVFLPPDNKDELPEEIPSIIRGPLSNFILDREGFAAAIKEEVEALRPTIGGRYYDESLGNIRWHNKNITSKTKASREDVPLSN